MHYWRPSIGVSGLTFYSGAEFPLWEGKLLVTALSPRELRLLTVDGERVQHEEVVFRAEGRPYEPVVGPDGRTVARGVVAYDASELDFMIGFSTQNLPPDLQRPVVHADDLARL